jgi:hypothetical protein
VVSDWWDCAVCGAVSPLGDHTPEEVAALHECPTPHESLPVARPACRPLRASDIERAKSSESIESIVEALRADDDVEFDPPRLGLTARTADLELTDEERAFLTDRAGVDPALLTPEARDQALAEIGRCSREAPLCNVQHPNRNPMVRCWLDRGHDGNHEVPDLGITPDIVWPQTFADLLASTPQEDDA